MQGTRPLRTYHGYGTNFQALTGGDFLETEVNRNSGSSQTQPFGITAKQFLEMKKSDTSLSKAWAIAGGGSQAQEQH